MKIQLVAEKSTVKDHIFWFLDTPHSRTDKRCFFPYIMWSHVNKVQGYDIVKKSQTFYSKIRSRDLFHLHSFLPKIHMTWWPHTCLLNLRLPSLLLEGMICLNNISHTDFCCKWPLGCHGQMSPSLFRNFPQCSTCISILIVVFLIGYQHAVSSSRIQFQNSAVLDCFLFLVHSIFNVLPNIVPPRFCSQGLCSLSYLTHAIRRASHSCLGCCFKNTH